MPFDPTVSIASITRSGVTFTVRRMGLGRRTDIDFATLALRQRLRQLEADHPPRSDREKDLAEQLEVANRKALAVPPEQFQDVMQKEVQPLADELAAAATPEVRKERAVLNEEYVQVENRIRAAWIRAGLVAIEGGDLDGMNADQLLDYGPPALALEIASALTSDGRLDGAERKNWQSLTISGEPADGDAKSSSAVAAAGPPAAGT